MIKLAEPTLGMEELEAIKNVLESKYLVQGDQVVQFESAMAKWLNVKHCIAVSSGTAALHLAIIALEIGRGDEVIVPAFTFPATSNVVEAVSATTVFIDIKLESLCMDETLIESAITNKTKAIIVVHEFGQAAEMEKVIKLAQKYNLAVIEDAACALGAKWQHKPVGTIGKVGCFSLHPRKAITTGEGGLITTNDDEIAKKIKQLRNHGIEIVNGKPRFVCAGLNYRMTNIQGAIGNVQFSKLEKINHDRKRLALMYMNLLKNEKRIRLPQINENTEHVWQTFHIIIDQDFNRDEIIHDLKERGIETNYGANAVHTEPYYLEKYGAKNLVNSEIANQFGLALPLHSQLRDEDIMLVVETLKAVLDLHELKE